MGDDDGDDDCRRRAGAKEMSVGLQSNHHCLRSLHLSKKNYNKMAIIIIIIIMISMTLVTCYLQTI